MNEGISFIVRIRNEEDVLEKSIRSLFKINVPHEIVLILHLCTDKSKEIAENLSKENPHIKIVEYLIPTSRAGYEMLCTDRCSTHSFVTYSMWCYKQTIYPWKFRWDADFVATDELIEYINNCSWFNDSTRTHQIYLNAVSPSGVSNTERYITSGNYEFTKHIFWEMICISEPTLTMYPSINIIHQSELSCKKKYWNNIPWFLDNKYLKENPEHYEEAITVLNRYIKLIEICGPEPNAHARAMNPENDDVYYKVNNNMNELKKFNIDPSY